MKVLFYSSKKWVSDLFTELKKELMQFTFLEHRLSIETASLSKGYDAICIFVNDHVTKDVIEILKENGVKLIALRCAGFNNVDIKAAEELGIGVVRVPAYSPYAVAEFAVGMILTLNRKYHRAFNRVRENNFSIDGLMGFDIKNKVVGVIGTGKIGKIFINIMRGFDTHILAYDKHPDRSIESPTVEYVDLDVLYSKSDIISLHCPLNYETYHLINKYSIEQMKKGVMIINTSRGALIDTNAVIDGLKSEKIGFLGLDVYEEEEDIFFEDLSMKIIQDDVFARLLTFPNVLITSHQAFFTKEAIENIVITTIKNIEDYLLKGDSPNLVTSEKYFK